MIRKHWKLFAAVIAVILCSFMGVLIYNDNPEVVSDVLSGRGLDGWGSGWCHSLTQMASMEKNDLSKCDENTLMSLLPVIEADKDKYALFLHATMPHSCLGGSIISEFHYCGKRYLQAVRAEAMLAEHSGRK